MARALDNPVLNNLLEQIRTLDKKRLREKMGRADSAVMEQVDAAIAVSFGLSGRRMI